MLSNNIQESNAPSRPPFPIAVIPTSAGRPPIQSPSTTGGHRSSYISPLLHYNLSKTHHLIQTPSIPSSQPPPSTSSSSLAPPVISSSSSSLSKPYRSVSEGAAGAPMREGGGEQRNSTHSSSSSPSSPPSPPPRLFLSCTVVSHRSRYSLDTRKKEYTEFEIRVVSPGLQWEVYKRYSEFAELNKQIATWIEELSPSRRSRLSPSSSSSSPFLLPKFPPSKIVGNLKQEFVQQRCLALDQWMKETMKIEEINTSPPVLLFLGALETRGASLSHSSSSSSNSNGTSSSSSPSSSHQPLQSLHLDALLSVLDAGDIVLFRTRGFLQRVQRTVTGSSYDHVGLVIRIPWTSTRSSALHLLEATSEGVRTYNLSRRLRAWYLSQAFIAIRQLKYSKKNNEFYSTLDAFVSDVDGLPYSLSVGKLIRRELGESNDAFFCSELIASAYMRVGLLDSNTYSASAFYPSSFNAANSDREFKLEQEALLGPELAVEFVQPAISEARAYRRDRRMRREDMEEGEKKEGDLDEEEENWEHEEEEWGENEFDQINDVNPTLSLPRPPTPPKWYEE